MTLPSLQAVMRMTSACHVPPSGARTPHLVSIGARSRFLGSSQSFLGTSCTVILRTTAAFAAHRLLLDTHERVVRYARQGHAWYTHRGARAGRQVSLSRLWGSIAHQWVVDSVRVGPRENIMVSGIPLGAFSPGAIHDRHGSSFLGHGQEMRVTLRRLPCRQPVLVVGRRGARATRLVHEPRVACVLVSMQGMEYPS